MSPWAINQLGEAVLRGAVIAYPTDTIWGFGCHPLIAHSVIRILNIKQRSIDKGLILLSPELSLLESYLDQDLTEQQLALLQKKTSRPTTWLVRAGKKCPPWLRGSFPTIAVRLTDHPFVSAICGKTGSPLVSTSANRSGRPSVRNSTQARLHFSSELDFIVGGFSTGSHQASEIKFLDSGISIRN